MYGHLALAAVMTLAPGAPRKVLMVHTSTSQIPNGPPTGVVISEVVHPLLALQAAGFEVELASPKGGVAPIDPRSDPRTPESFAAADTVTKAFLSTPSSATILQKTQLLSKVNLSSYAAIVFAGGTGASFDFPNSKNGKRLVLEAVQANKPVGALCHGTSALLNVTLKNGEPLVKGR